jgi:hypothetical protein
MTIEFEQDKIKKQYQGIMELAVLRGSDDNLYSFIGLPPQEPVNERYEKLRVNGLNLEPIVIFYGISLKSEINVVKMANEDLRGLVNILIESKEFSKKQFEKQLTN